MWAALRLRLVEARRRGGLLLGILAFLAVGATAIWGGATPDGRYGLASDVAATLGYLLAILYGTVPVAADRERRRSYLPAASPVTPWGWALGNALGAAAVAALTAGLLFVAAGIGTALSGGIETHAVTYMDEKAPGLLREPFPVIRVGDARKLRLLALTELRDENEVGAAFAARLEIDGEVHAVHSGLPIVVPVRHDRVSIRNVTPEYRVGLVTREIRALGAREPFLANAAGVAVPPALGAAAIAAFGAAVGANLSAGVAALLVTLVLALAAMKGFLGEALAQEDSPHAQTGHVHGAPAAPAGDGALRVVAKGVLRGVLAVLPDLDALDRTDRVATGEWTGVRGAGRAALILAVALAVAGGIGGIGVRLRRMP